MKDIIFIEALITITLVILVPAILKFIKAKVAEMENNYNKEVIISLVEGAEKMLKASDPTGEKRKEYVLKQLQELGIEPNEYINALIEQAVLNMWV